MTNENDIQDFSMIDDFISNNLKQLNEKYFGDLDEETGYFEEDDTQDEEETDETVPNDEQQEGVSDQSAPGNYSSGARTGVLSDLISAKESGGDYNAFNSAGGGAGAVGKYQFRWNLWKDKIAAVTGVKARDDFRKNPAAQEKFYSWYEANELMPAADRLARFNKRGLNKTQIAKLVHFQGEEGAKKYLQGQMGNKPQPYNSSISDYIMQAGGEVDIAATPDEQYTGLNNSQFNDLLLPLEGVNTIRGIDDGTPIFAQDELGQQAVLQGAQHTVRMKGKVLEHRI